MKHTRAQWLSYRPQVQELENAAEYGPGGKVQYCHAMCPDHRAMLMMTLQELAVHHRAEAEATPAR